MDRIIRELEKNKNVEKNISEYASRLSELYYRRALVSLCFDYYELRDYYNEADNAEEYKKDIEEIGSILKKMFGENNSPEDNEIIFNKILKMRADNRKLVYQLAEVRDVLIMYKNIYKKKEIKLRDNLDEEIKKIDDKKLVADIRDYIYKSGGIGMTNYNITEVLRILPVRLTKNKFFEYIRGALNVYTSSDKKTIDEYVDNLRSCAVTGEENFDKLSEDFRKAYKEIRRVYQEDMNEQEEKYRSRIEGITDKIIRIQADADVKLDIYRLIQKILNKAMTVLLLVPYMVKDFKEEKLIAFIVNKDEISEEDELSIFEKLEGVPEELDIKISESDYYLDIITDDYRDIIKATMEGKVYGVLEVVNCLMSNSLFIEIEKINEAKDDGKVSNDNAVNTDNTDSIDNTEVSSNDDDMSAYIDEKFKELEEELRTAFRSNDRALNKEIMAAILSKLPVFFNSNGEINEYIETSVYNCLKPEDKIGMYESFKVLFEATQYI